MIDNDQIRRLIQLRKELHTYPELSGNEHKTVKKIIDFLKPYQPHRIITELGHTGAAFIYNGIEKGNTVIIRCDLDALPIHEKNNISYRSLANNIAHMCGHDGHMSIVAGLAGVLHENKPKKGRVVLLFQPAEETGQGAKQVLSDKKFKDIEPDYILALHNLPGFKTGSIILAQPVFSSASQGMIIKLEGRTSHASEPEKGNSPAAAVTDIIRFFSETASKKNLHAGAFATVIYVKIGEIAFGTSPGMAEVMATLRSPSDAGLKELSENALETIRGIAENYNLNYELAWTEEFAAVRNDLQCTEAVEKAAIQNGYEIIKMERPFRWSEDFGLYTQSYKGALFGLGAGISAPSLHSPDYEFPDDLIEPGIRMFFTALSSLL